MSAEPAASNGHLHETRRVVVTSVGTAAPASSAAVARGLGVPVGTVVASLYRAPAVLVDRVAPDVADRMVELLSGIGYVARVEPQAAPAPGPVPLYDLALHVADARAIHAAAEALAAFTGAPTSEALMLILTPPGVVLGGVSSATIDAFEATLPPGVEAVRSRPEDALYHLFVTDGPEVLRTRLLEDLAGLGLGGAGVDGLVAVGVPHRTVRELWRRHQAGGLLRVVNGDFLRFDLVLRAADGADRDDPRTAEALHATAGMPAGVIGQVLAALPVTLAQGLRADGLATALGAFDGLGLDVRAEMTTFQLLGLDVLDAPDGRGALAVLRSFGVLGEHDRIPACPFRVDGRLPELQARILRAALEDAGATVRFADDDR